MSDPLWGEARPSRPYGSEPGARPRDRDSGLPPSAPRRPAAGARTPRRDPGRGESARGSDPAGRDPGWGGRDSGLRGPGGNGRDPGPPAGRRGDSGADAQTRRAPVPSGVRGDGSRSRGGRGDGSPPRGVWGDGSPQERGVPGGRPPGSTPSTPPAATRSAMTQPGGMRDGVARGIGGPGDSRGRRNSPRPRSPGRPRRWGALQGGLGVCIIVASAAIGAVVTMVTRSAPGALLGLFVVAGTVAASLAIRPRAGRMIFPVPVLSYLVTALISGAVFDRSADSSKTALAIAAAQWIADGFFAMALATVLAVLITAARWYLWRRRRPATRDPGWPVPPAGPTRTGPARAGTVRPGTGRDGTVRGPGGPAGWGDPGSRGTGPPPTPRPGSEPYNFSSGA